MGRKNIWRKSRSDKVKKEEVGIKEEIEINEEVEIKEDVEIK
jgi:hypothetical protein